MSWSDDDWGKPFFPTRFGSPQGHATERKMLDAVGGFDGIRTKIRTNPDGSTTILKTRGGMPVFTTTQPAQTPIAQAIKSLFGFVAVPVSFTYPGGFRYNAGVFEPMATFPFAMEADAPGSAVINLGTTGPAFKYNQLYSSKVVSPAKTDQHPGNRTWRWKQKGKMLAWWSPFPLFGTFWGVDKPHAKFLLGGSQQRVSDSGGTPISPWGAWDALRGMIYLDGEPFADVTTALGDGYVLAAAAKEFTGVGGTYTELYLLVISKNDLDPYGYGSMMRIVTYNVEAQTFSSNYLSIRFRISSVLNSLHAFNESATALLCCGERYWSVYGSYKASVVEVSLAGTENFAALENYNNFLTPGPVNTYYDKFSRTTAHDVTFEKEVIVGFYYAGDSVKLARVKSNIQSVNVVGATMSFPYSGMAWDSNSSQLVPFSGTMTQPGWGSTLTVSGWTEVTLGDTLLARTDHSRLVSLVGEAHDTTTISIDAYGGYVTYTPFTETTTNRVQNTGTGALIEFVTPNGDAMIHKTPVSYDRTETSVYDFVWSGSTTTNSSAGSALGYSITANEMYFRFRNGTTIDLSYLIATPYAAASFSLQFYPNFPTMLGGNIIPRGGMATLYDGSAALLSMAGIRSFQINNEVEGWTPIYTLTIGYYTAKDAMNNPVITPFTISPEWLGDTRYMEAVTCSRAITQENP